MSKSHIIAHIKQTGLHVDERGMCHGIAMMAIQAFLLGAEQYQHYLRRLKTIMEKPVEPSINWGDYVDVHAYFQGVTLYNLPNQYLQLFSPDKRYISHFNTNEISTVAQSKLAEEQQGILKIDRFFGLYNRDEEIEHYLTSYQQAVKEITLEKGHKKLRCALLLSSYNHAIMLAYDVDDQRWYLQDHDARYEHTDIQSVIKQIKEAYGISSLTDDSALTLATTIYSLGNEQGAASLVYKSWSTHEHWKQIHKITPEKAKMVNESGGLLYSAAEYGCLGLVMELLDAGAPVDAVMKRGDTPLYRAVQNGHTETVELLLVAGASMDVVFTAGFTSIHLAAQNSHIETVQLFLNRKTVNAATTEGFTPLHIVVMNGHKAVAELLIGEGASVDAVMMEGFTPLHLAAMFGDTDMVQLLLKAGASVNAVTEHGATPLYLAAQCGYTKIVKLLLAAGANVNAATKHGATPLYIAAQNGHIETVNLLLDEKADVFMAISGKIEVLHQTAIAHGREEEFLTLKTELKPSAKGEIDNFSPLDATLFFCRPEIAMALIQAGAQIREEHTLLFLDWLCKAPWHNNNASQELLRPLRDAVIARCNTKEIKLPAFKYCFGDLFRVGKRPVSSCEQDAPVDTNLKYICDGLYRR